MKHCSRNARSTLLAALARNGERFGLAWLELSSGRFTVLEAEGADALAAEFERLRPAELLIADGDSASDIRIAGSVPARVRPGTSMRTPRHARLASSSVCATSRASARGQCRSRSGAAGCLLQYVRDTQKSALPHLRGLRREERSDALLIDAATRRNLELDSSLSGRPECTLLGVLDRSATAMGGRELRRWL